MSAHPAEVLARHGHTTLNVPFLAKPYTRGEVLVKVKEALEQSRPRKRILVVDDDPGIRTSLGKLLTTAGHEVILAENGGDATRLLREIGPDLVILDLFMPEKDGLETLMELRKQMPRLAIIVMSGGAWQIDLLPEAKLLGASWTIEKPFIPAAMMALVDSALGDSRKTNA
jgi:DNA-binding NtrC family response regulator